MADEGFTPDPQPSNPQKVDDGFTPDTAPQASTPSWNPKDVAINAAKGVAAVLEPISLPLRYAASAVAKQVGMEVENKPLAIYPGSAPTTQWSDVIKYGADKAGFSGDNIFDKALNQWGWSPTSASAMAAAVNTGVFGVGMLGDFIGDPMMWIGVGVPNKATRAALEAGKDISKVERSTIAITTPLRGKVLAEATFPKVNELAQKGVDVARIVYNPLDWRTGDHELDAGSVIWAGRKANVPKAAAQEFGVPFHKANPSEEEIKVMTNVAESTPNLRPNLKNLTRELTPEESAVLGLDEIALRSQISARIQRAAQEEGVRLVPGRELVIEDLMMKAKQMNARTVELQEKMGRLDYSRPLNEQLIENYLPHVKTPEAKKALKGVSEEAIKAAQEEGKLAKEADQLMNRQNLTNYNPFGKQREIRYPVRQANEIMVNSGKTGEALREAGVGKLFQENPYVASYENYIKKSQAALDQEFVQLMNQKGFNYIEENGRPRVEYGASKEMWRAMTPKQKDWTQNVESKLQHLVAPGESGMGRKLLEKYNRIFRATTLMKPNYYIQNFGDALAKNAIQGVGPKSYLDAYKAWTGRGTISLGGKSYLASDVKKILVENGAMNTGHFGETVNAALTMAKRATADGASINKAGGFSRMLENVRAAGSSGENWARSSMVLDRLDRGYNIKQALYDMENFHFNFSRTTKSMDALRLIFPFAQFPLKTIGIAGDLILKKPGVFNQQQFLLQQIDRAMNDPLESATLRKLKPEYAQFGGAVPIGDAGYFMSKAGDAIDNLLGGNSWLGKAFTYPGKSESGLPQYQVYTKLPIGTDALNQWALFEGEILKNGGFMSGPAWSFIQGMITGKDQFTGASFDPNPNQVSPSERLKGTSYNMAASAVNFPTIAAIIKQEMGMTDERFTTPAAMRLINAAFGGPNGFVEMYNVDRSYLIKKMVFSRQIKEQEKFVKSLYMKEKAAGKANTSWMSGVPGTTAREAFNELRLMVPEIGLVQQLSKSYTERPGPMVDPKTRRAYANQELAKAVADYKGMLKANKQLDENFVAVKNRQIEALKEEMKARGMGKQNVLELYKLRDAQAPEARDLPEDANAPEEQPQGAASGE